MLGAHQNLNGSRDLATHLSGMVCHPWAITCYRHLTYDAIRYDTVDLRALKS